MSGFFFFKNSQTWNFSRLLTRNCTFVKLHRFIEGQNLINRAENNRVYGDLI